MINHYPYWWDLNARPEPTDQTDLPSEIDAVVVGSGLTGLSAARTLSSRGLGVLVIDSGEPGIGASTRNGGMVGGGHIISASGLTERYGTDLAKRLLKEAHLDSIAFVRKVITDEAIDCDFQDTGRFRGLWRSRELTPAARELEQLKKLVDIEAHMISRQEQYNEVATDLYQGGVIYPRHGAINPARFTRGLLASAKRSGAIIQGNTRFLSSVCKNGKHHVKTSRGDVISHKLLMATNGYSTRDSKLAHRHIIPIPSYLIATRPLGREKVSSLFPSGRMIVETRDRHCYYRPSPDGDRIIFGGRAAMVPISESTATARMAGLMAQTFPQLGPVEISHSWTGFTGFSFERLPHVGQYDQTWYAMGYSGNGNTMAPYLGHMAALSMMEDKEGETGFRKTRFETRWWYRGHPWFLTFLNIGLRMGDWLNRPEQH